MGYALSTLRLRSIVGAIVCGFLLSLGTGLVENQPGVGIPELNHYGYPLVWRVTKTFEPTEFRFASLAIDAAFWITVCFLVLIVLEMLRLRVGFRYETLLLPLVLFIPLGLVMDFVHEFGHAMWGIAVGGRLISMKITYFQIYPQVAVSPQFCLGCVQVGGLATAFASGLMSLGGSLTTNIVSWVLVLVLLRTSPGFKTRVALRILGLFGLLDLPFYVLFPQVGLRHWIFLGGAIPEPLIGARKLGIPDPAFYATVVLTTLGLLFLWFKPLWKKAEMRIKLFVAVARPKQGGSRGTEEA